MSAPVTQPPDHIERTSRVLLPGHLGMVVLFTGLSGSGKTTLSRQVEERLHQQGVGACVLDGDQLRTGLCSDLTFSARDRCENIRRVGEVGKLMANAGLVVLAAFIAPFEADRRQMGRGLPPRRFLVIHCQCPLAVCEERDVKGLYRLARAGKIAEFTGISSPYEPPENPDLVLLTDVLPIATCVEQATRLIVERYG